MDWDPQSKRAVITAITVGITATILTPITGLTIDRIIDRITIDLIIGPITNHITGRITPTTHRPIMRRSMGSDIIPITILDMGMPMLRRDSAFRLERVTEA